MPNRIRLSMAAKTVTTKLQSSHDSIRIRQTIASIYHVIRMSVTHSANFGEKQHVALCPTLALDVVRRHTHQGKTDDDRTSER